MLLWLLLLAGALVIGTAAFSEEIAALIPSSPATDPVREGISGAGGRVAGAVPDGVADAGRSAAGAAAEVAAAGIEWAGELAARALGAVQGGST